MKKQHIFAITTTGILLALAGCSGKINNSANSVTGRWSVSSTSCVNPIELKPLGQATVAIPYTGTISARWSQNKDLVTISKTVAGNALLGVKVKIELTEPQNYQMTIKSAHMTGAGGADLNFLKNYNKLYKCQ